MKVCMERGFTTGYSIMNYIILSVLSRIVGHYPFTFVRIAANTLKKWWVQVRYHCSFIHLMPVYSQIYRYKRSYLLYCYMCAQFPLLELHSLTYYICQGETNNLTIQFTTEQLMVIAIKESFSPLQVLPSEAS